MLCGKMFQSLDDLPESHIKIVVDEHEIGVFVGGALQTRAVLQSAFEILFLIIQPSRFVLFLKKRRL